MLADSKGQPITCENFFPRMSCLSNSFKYIQLFSKTQNRLKIDSLSTYQGGNVWEIISFTATSLLLEGSGSDELECLNTLSWSRPVRTFQPRPVTEPNHSTPIRHPLHLHAYINHINSHFMDLNVNNARWFISIILVQLWPTIWIQIQLIQSNRCHIQV